MADPTKRDARAEHVEPPPPAAIHLVSHTHWDREWYQPAGVFRQRLVRLIDELLDDDRDQAPFLLDGQAIVLEDYASVRPERVPLLAARLAGGSLEAGPWYVLADELIPSGEALVRNLLTGRRIVARFGATPPPVLYSPDAFGHAAALPLLAAGFGCDVIIAWRGYGSARWPAGDTAWWTAPDGSRALLFHLPRDGYEAGSNLPSDAAGAGERWRRLGGELATRSRTGLLLVTNGADHHARQASLGTAVEALRTAAAPVPVERRSLASFAAELVARARRTELPQVAGELRDSYGYTWTLQGTFATRAHQKRANAAVERLLVREAEPFATLARALGGVSSRPALHAAWSALLQCHPHDTLCGCSIDDVARAMDARLADAAAQALAIRAEATAALVAHDANEARTRRTDWRPVVLARNAAPRPRGGVAELVVDEFLADVPVGPGSAPQSAPRLEADHATAPRVSLSLGGAPVPVQVLAERETWSRTEASRYYPDNDLVRRWRVVAWLADVPAYGVAALRIDSAGAPRARRRPFRPVVAGTGSLDNGILTVSVSDTGVVSLARADGSWRVADLIGFEDVADRGDLYTHAPVGPLHTDAELLGARLVHRGPLRGELALRWRMRVPAERGSQSEVSIVVLVRLRLDAESPVLHVLVEGENRARDHRLRVALRTGVAGADVFADAAFGPVRRQPIVVPDADAAMETPPPTAPLHRYVSLFGEERGATIYSDGLAEYEAADDGAVAVTLVRAVGELSRNDLPERPGHAGWPVHTPDAQCIGPFGGHFAILPHGARTDDVAAEIERVADDVLLPLCGDSLRSALTLPAPVLGARLDGAGLAFGALKDAETGGAIVVRCVNLLGRDVEGRWTLGVPIASARLARLDETPLDELPVDGNTVRFTAGPRAVVTILLHLARPTT